MRARLLLAAIVVPAFTVTAQPQGGAATSGATPAARAGSARVGQARARSAWIDDELLASTRATRSDDLILERLRSAVFLGALDPEPRAAEDVSFVGGAFSVYSMPGGVFRAVHAEPGEQSYQASPAIEKAAGRPAWQPTVRVGSGCWWLWVFTGTPVCW